MDKVFIVQFIAGHRTRKILGVFDSQEAAQSCYPDIPDDLFEDEGIWDKGYNVICTDVLSLDNMFRFSKNAKPRKLLHIKRLIHKYAEGFREFEGFLVSTEFDNLLYNAQQDAKRIINIIDMMLEPIEGE